MGWPVPVWTDKRATDACFERMAAMFVAAMPRRAGRGRRQAGPGIAQRPLDRPHAGPAGETWLAAVGRRVPEAVRHGRSAARGAGGTRPAGPRVRAAGRDDSRHGLPRPPAAWKTRRTSRGCGPVSRPKCPTPCCWPRPNPRAVRLSSPAQPAESVAAAREPGAAAGISFRRPSPGWATAGRCSTSRWRDFSQEDQRQQFARAVAEVDVPQVAAVGADACRQAIAAAAAAFPAWRDRPSPWSVRRSSCRPRPRCAAAAIGWPP